ncbi:MAG: hypothetical protein ACE5LU_28280 [Anaerolineae bacterium]
MPTLVVEREVVDHDTDLLTLRRRIRQRFGRTPVMITLVEDAPERALIRHGFDNPALPGISAVGDDQGDEIILGRNVLNQLRLLLDGPANITEVLTR